MNIIQVSDWSNQIEFDNEVGGALIKTRPQRELAWSLSYLAAGMMFQNAVVPNGLGSMTHSSMELGL